MLIVMLVKRWVGRWHLEALGFAFLVAYAPLGVTYLESPADFFFGVREISALRNWYAQELFGPEASLPRYLPQLLFEQVRRTLGLFVKQGDLSGYYPSGPPAFDVVTVMLIWLGLGAALSRFRRYHEAALLVWLGFGVLFGSAVTVGGRERQPDPDHRAGRVPAGRGRAGPGLGAAPADAASSAPTGWRRRSGRRSRSGCWRRTS